MTKLMMESIKSMFLIAAMVAVMVVSFAVPAIADEVKDEHKAQNEEPLKDEEPLTDQGIRDSQDEQGHNSGSDPETKDPSSSVEDRLKDPGIRLCDITPTECQDSGDSQDDKKKNEYNDEDEESLKDLGIRLCDIVPTECDNTNDSQDDKKKKKKKEHNDQDEYPEYCKGVVYDPRACGEKNDHNDKDEEPLKDPGIKLCDITLTECHNTDDPKGDQSHKSGALPDTKDPNPGDDEASKEEEKETSASGEVKAAEVPGGTTKTTPVNDKASDPKEAVSASNEVGQIANSEPTSGQLANSSPKIRACHFDSYEYNEKYDTCVPSLEDVAYVIGTFTGQLPAPDSFGGYVSLPLHFPSDLLAGVGFALEVGLGHYVGDNLVDYGKDVGGPLGYGLQGLGYPISAVADTAAVFLEGAGQIVGAVTDSVGTAVDTVVDNVVTPVLGGVVDGVEAVVESVEKVADVAKSTWKKISSWF
jgi:hypothetical protein